ncbi:hypothetical protein [Winogradskyella sp.]|uniref:hypothetical protein n=1 Tax=Winogradskyella sp. TaxID=1883156 RepID=UPI003AB8FAB4
MYLSKHGYKKKTLTLQEYASLPSSYLRRWKNEAGNKYLYSDINKIIKQKIELIKRLNQSSNVKKLNESYLKLHDKFHEVISTIKGNKTLYPRTITNGTALNKVMAEVLPIYNNQRPKLILSGYTPHETFNSTSIYLGQYRQGFMGQKSLRIKEIITKSVIKIFLKTEN